MRDRLEVGVIVGWFIGFVINAAIVGGLIYAAVHFINKFW